MAVDFAQQPLKKNDIRELHVRVERFEGDAAIVRLEPVDPAGHAANAYRPHFQVRPIDLLRLDGAGSSLARGELCAVNAKVVEVQDRDGLNVTVKVQTPLGEDAKSPVGGLKIHGGLLRPTTIRPARPDADLAAESAPSHEVGGPRGEKPAEAATVAPAASGASAARGASAGDDEAA